MDRGVCRTTWRGLGRVGIILVLAMGLSGCARTMGCYEGRFTVITKTTTVDGDGLVMTGGMNRADCLTLREELERK